MLAPLMAKLVIEISDEFLEAASRTGHLEVRLDSTAVQGSDASTPRKGSWPDRVLRWAAQRSQPFRPRDIQRQFKLSRTHAGMILSRLVNSSLPLDRVGRGLYAYDK